MRMRVVLLISVLVVSSLGACSSGGSDSSKDDGGAGGVDACLNEKKTLRTAAEAFNASMERYPTKVEELLADNTAPDGSKVPAQIVRPPQFWSLKTDPADGNVVPKAGVELPDGCA